MIGQAKAARQKTVHVKDSNPRRVLDPSQPALESHSVKEVHPPRKARSDRQGRQTVGPEFFPLVSAAHEFKTPLVAMLGYTGLLRDARLGPLNEKQRRVLGEIQESAERLQKLIQDLLLLCELKTSKGPAASRIDYTADVNAHVREIFNYWVPLAAQKPISYDFQPAARRPRVRVHTLRLQHIVSNLIENAIKYTPAGGKVVVRVTQCFWDRRRAPTGFLFNMQRQRDRKIENAVRIDVSDNGPGIHADFHEDIFGDFIQLPGASSRGTGLGLAIARRLTEAHGGAIWVESEPGHGSKFSLLLTQAKHRQETQAHARQHIARG